MADLITDLITEEEFEELAKNWDALHTIWDNGAPDGLYGDLRPIVVLEQCVMFWSDFSNKDRGYLNSWLLLAVPRGYRRYAYGLFLEERYGYNVLEGVFNLDEVLSSRKDLFRPENFSKEHRTFFECCKYARKIGLIPTGRPIG